MHTEEWNTVFDRMGEFADRILAHKRLYSADAIRLAELAQYAVDHYCDDPTIPADPGKDAV